jgi:hypothetical protein
MAAMGDEAKFYAEEVNNVFFFCFLLSVMHAATDFKIPKEYKCVTQLPRSKTVFIDTLPLTKRANGKRRFAPCSYSGVVSKGIDLMTSFPPK